MTVSEEHIAEVDERLIVVDPEASSASSTALAQREDLLRIARGAYLQEDPTWSKWELQTMVSLARIVWAQRRYPGAVFVLESAAILHELPLLENELDLHMANLPKGNTRKTELPTIPKLAEGSRNERLGHAVHRHGFTVPEADVETIHGIRVCSIERLIVDFARLRPARLSLVPIDAACARITAAWKFERQRTLQRMDALRSRLAVRLKAIPGSRGSARAREVIAWADPFSESPGESLVRWGLGAFGLPRPVLQQEVQRDGSHYFLDLWIREFNVAIEFDGAMKYKGDDAHQKLMGDKRRDDHLQAEGVRVVHLMWADVVSPEALRKALIKIFGLAVLVAASPRFHLLVGSGLQPALAA
nr:hypothetical protein [Actinomycetales bacterium]